MKKTLVMFFVQFVCSGLKKHTKASCLIKKLNLHFFSLENLKKCKFSSYSEIFPIYNKIKNN